MNESVKLSGELMRNSLILIGLTFRTFSTAVSDCIFPPSDHEALMTRSPLKAAGPEVTLKVALALAPGAIVSENDETAELHPLGAEMLRWTPLTRAPLVFVNVTVTSCEE